MIEQHNRGIHTENRMMCYVHNNIFTNNNYTLVSNSVLQQLLNGVYCTFSNMSLLYLVVVIGVLNTVDVYKELSKSVICIYLLYDVAMSVVERDSPFKALQSGTYLFLHIFQNLCSFLKITLHVYEHSTPSSATHQPCVKHRKHAWLTILSMLVIILDLARARPAHESNQFGQ